MLATLGTIALVLGAGWYAIFGLHYYDVTQQEIHSKYSYQLPTDLQMQVSPISQTQFSFTYTSFDGAIVNGEIHYPTQLKELRAPIPVMVGIHAMARSHVRWWQDRIDDRMTLENTHKITEQALEKGYAVVAIDARNHGKRKDPNLSIIDIIDDLHWWGKREPYENMLINTVKDHRILIDWLTQQPQFDQDNIHVAGYSMGAHISLLLGGTEPRINRVLAIVPPYINNRTAIVSPLNMLNGLADNPVLLLSANDDEYASEQENQALFDTLPNVEKSHFTFDSGHVLPESYLLKLENWFH